MGAGAPPADAIPDAHPSSQGSTLMTPGQRAVILVSGRQKDATMTRHHARATLLVAAVAGVALALSGCAGDGGGSTDAADAEAGGSGGGGSECTTALTATLPDGTSVSLTEAGAATFGDGVSYSTFASDFAPDPDTNLLLEYPAVPDDGTIAYISTAVFNQETDHPALAPGDEIAWTRDFDVVTFAVIVQSGADQFSTSTDGAGTLSVSEVSDDRICFDLEYTDAEKAVSGTLSADVVS